MRIRIRLFEVWMYLLLIIATGITLIFPIALDTWRTVLTLFSVFLIICSYITHIRLKKKERNSFIKIYIVLFILILFYELMKSVYIYNYNIYEQFYALRQYIWVILALPFYIILIRSKNYISILENVVNIVIVSLVLRTITWMFNSFLGITIFPYLLYEYGNEWSRNGIQRIDATPLIGIVIPILFYLYIIKKKKKYICELIFVFIYLLVISQTRMLIIGYLMSIFSMVFFKNRTTTKKFVVQMSFLGIIGVVSAFGGVEYVLQYLDLSDGLKSLGYRYYEFQYFSSLLQDGKWRTGIGILSSINAEGAKILYGNLNTQMYLDDLGMFECILQFGLFSIVLYFFIYIYMIKVIKQCNNNSDYNSAILLIGILTYIFIVSIPLNLYGIQRSFSVALIIAITCAISNKQGKMKKYKIVKWPRRIR